MGRKICHCGKAQAVRPGGLCNRCFAETNVMPKQEPPTEVPLDQIRIDGGTQSRVNTDQATVDNYAEAMQPEDGGMGDEFPPGHAFFDGAHYWLWDGFHRYLARQKLKLPTMKLIVRPGTQRDAVLASLGANAKNALQRSDEDKRKAVRIMLADDEWSGWSDRAIARQCCVSQWLVGDVKRKLAEKQAPQPKPEVTAQSPEPTPEPEQNPNKTKEEKAESEPEVTAQSPNPDRLTDEIGNPVTTPEAREAFIARVEFEELASQLTRLNHEIGQLAKATAGAVLSKLLKCTTAKEQENFKYSSKDLQKVRDDLLGSRPHSVICPYCHDAGLEHNDKNCAVCQGRPYVTERQWNNAREEVRKGVEALVKS